MGELTKDEYETVRNNTSPLGEKLTGSTLMLDDDFEAECSSGACPIR